MYLRCSYGLSYWQSSEVRMFITILANILVALFIITLIFFAVRSLIRQGRQEGCGSCSSKKDKGCKGCSYADHCK